jgi:NAD-dependent deacetylase
MATGATIEQLIEWLRTCERVVVFTGAGVSTLSGIPDFRGPNGLYRRPDADRIFDIDGFQRDPSLFYSAAREFIYVFDRHEPSLVHTECARLECVGRVARVITQNIDMLHQRAGSRDVIELHGSPERHDCLDCGRVFSYAWARDLVQAGRVPICPDCGGPVKPGITFFGELLPPGAFEAAADEAASADLMLVLGSSLVVYPAASVPLYTVQHGGRLAIVNAGATPLDRLADCRLQDLEATFRTIAASL